MEHLTENLLKEVVIRYDAACDALCNHHAVVRNNNAVITERAMTFLEIATDNMVRVVSCCMMLSRIYKEGHLQDMYRRANAQYCTVAGRNARAFLKSYGVDTDRELQVLHGARMRFIDIYEKSTKTFYRYA